MQIQISINSIDLYNLPQCTTGSAVHTERIAAGFPELEDGLTSCLLPVKSSDAPVSLTHRAFKGRK